MSTQEITEWLTTNGYDSPADAVLRTFAYWTRDGGPNGRPGTFKLPIPVLTNDGFADGEVVPLIEIQRACVFTAEPGYQDGKKCVRFMGTIPGLEMEPVEVAVLVKG